MSKFIGFLLGFLKDPKVIKTVIGVLVGKIAALEVEEVSVHGAVCHGIVISDTVVVAFCPPHEH